MSTDTTQFDGADYLRKAREADARYLADTRALIAARTDQDIADILTRTTGQRHEPTDTMMAMALGALGMRAEFIIQRLEKAEARVAELEAEHACQHGTTCIGPECNRA